MRTTSDIIAEIACDAHWDNLIDADETSRRSKGRTTMEIRVCYKNVEEIYNCGDMLEAVEDFLSSHDNIDAEEMTITEVGSFYDRNR